MVVHTDDYDSSGSSMGWVARARRSATVLPAVRTRRVLRVDARARVHARHRPARRVTPRAGGARRHRRPHLRRAGHKAERERRAAQMPTSKLRSALTPSSADDGRCGGRSRKRKRGARLLGRRLAGLSARSRGRSRAAHTRSPARRRRCDDEPQRDAPLANCIHADRTFQSPGVRFTRWRLSVIACTDGCFGFVRLADAL